MKKKIGFFDFTGCEGCQLSILGLEDQFMEVLELVEIVEFRQILDAMPGQAIDIAFVEGSVCTPEEGERLRRIRKQSDIVVALGACADMAGVNALRRSIPEKQLCQEVYGSLAKHLQPGEPQPLAALIEVDYRLPGCPVIASEFLSLLQSLLLDKEQELPGYSLCVECKLAEIPCTFDRGEVCLGPVTRAGCQAICIDAGDRCRGCRGPMENPRISPYNQILYDHGLTLEDVLQEFRTFNFDFGKDS